MLRASFTDRLPRSTPLLPLNSLVCSLTSPASISRSDGHQEEWAVGCWDEREQHRRRKEDRILDRCVCFTAEKCDGVSQEGLRASNLDVRTPDVDRCEGAKVDNVVENVFFKIVGLCQLGFQMRFLHATSHQGPKGLSLTLEVEGFRTLVLTTQLARVVVRSRLCCEVSTMNKLGFASWTPTSNAPRHQSA